MKTNEVTLIIKSQNSHRPTNEKDIYKVEITFVSKSIKAIVYAKSHTEICK